MVGELVTVSKLHCPPPPTSGRGFATMLRLGDGFMSTQIHLPPKFSFSSDFRHFILKMLKNAKFTYVSRKKILEYHNFWGDVPLIMLLRGSVSPPPFSTPMTFGDVPTLLYAYRTNTNLYQTKKWQLYVRRIISLHLRCARQGKYTVTMTTRKLSSSSKICQIH